MNFKIEFSDTDFRLIVVNPSGFEDYLEIVPYCSVSSVVGQDGKVYGAYLTGSEPELDTLTNHPTDTEMPSVNIKVYELSAWPTLRPMDGSVTILETEFEDDEDDTEDEDEAEGADIIEVKPV